MRKQSWQKLLEHCWVIFDSDLVGLDLPWVVSAWIPMSLLCPRTIFNEAFVDLDLPCVAFGANLVDLDLPLAIFDADFVGLGRIFLTLICLTLLRKFLAAWALHPETNLNLSIDQG